MGSQAGVGAPNYDRIKAAAGQDTADAIQQLFQLLSKTRVDTDQLLSARVGSGPDVRLLRCTAYRSTVQAVSDGVTTAMQFDAEDAGANPALMHDVSTNNTRITFPRAGWWSAHGRIAFVANATGGRTAAIGKNGGTLLGAAIVAVNSATQFTIMEVHLGPTLFAAGDYLELFAIQDSGGILNTGNVARQSANELSVRPVQMV